MSSLDSIGVTTLENGLRIVTDTMRDAESVVVGTWVGVGTRHEPWNANGVAHLVEHMMFKGTKKRSAYALSSQIENNGGMMNAHTTREETAYYARVLPEDIGLATDIIADMLQRSVFAPKELDRERQVIIQEIGRDMDSPEDRTFDFLHEKAFPKQKLGRPILGVAPVIAKLPRASVKAYVRDYYHAGNMTVIAAGRVTHDDFVSTVKACFGKLPKGPKPKAEKTHFGHGAKFVTKEIEQLHLILGFPGPGRFAREVYAAQILSVLLGGSSSSRLFQKVREKRGLVYSVSAGHMAFSDAGIFQIYAGTDPTRVKELVPVICNELIDVTKNVSRSELARAKAQIRADILMGKESTMRRAEIIGSQVTAYGRVIPVEETVRKIMDLTQDDMHAVALKMFRKKPIVAALGPLEQLESYTSIAERLSR